MRKLTFLLTFMLFVAFQASAQMTISGKVTNAETGEPIPGASIYVKSQSTIGSTSDMDGNYTLKGVPSDAETLVFSFVGMQEKEVPINGRSTIDVKMQPSVQEMDEVVVVGYGVSKKSTFTGSAGQVDNEKLADKPVTNVSEALKGTVSGISIGNASGQPGSVRDIQIRGMGSFSAGNRPLVIVDGVPINSDGIAQFDNDGGTEYVSGFSMINPDNIENVSVLKDAAATSIYGSKASNGVILITTKSGQEGKTKFNFSTQMGFSERLKGSFEPLTAKQWKDLKYEGLVNSGVNPTSAYNTISQYPDKTVDWFDAGFRRGSSNQYSLSARGGNKDTKFFISGKVNNQEGVVEGTNNKKYTGRINVEHNATEKLTINTRLQGSFMKTNKRPGGRGSFMDPITGMYFNKPVTPIYNEDGSYAHQTVVVGGNNFVENIEKGIFQAQTESLNANTDLSYDFTDHLTFKTKGGLSLIELKEEQFWHPDMSDAQDVNGLGQQADSRRFNWIITNTLRYDNTFNEAHNVNALLGQEAQNFADYYTYLSAQQYPTGQLPNLDNAADPQSASTTRTEYAIASYFGRLKYNFKGRYYLQASLRRDGSSRFGADNKWANFWSVGGNWRISEESFMEGLTMINDLKIRGSYGTTGNQSGIGNFAAQGLYGFGANYNSQPGSQPVQSANPNLKWEESRQLNFALEGRVIDALSFTVGYYKNTQGQLLVNVPVSSTVGVAPPASQLRNIGEMESRGVEVDLSAEIFKKGDFKWFIDGNISFNQNEVTKLYKGEDVIAGIKIRREGEEYHSWYMAEYAGVNPATGQAMWYDSDGNLVDDYAKADRQIVGDANPDIYGGLGTNLSYKGIGLSAQFDYMQGKDIYVDFYRYMKSDGAYLYNQSHTQLNRWQEPGDITETPKIIEGNSTNSNGTSTRQIEDGSYIRLTNVTLSYSLPKNIIERINLSKARIFVTGQNLITWTPYHGMDPLDDADGQKFFEYPKVKKIVLGVNVGF
jgi:TonB-linked SusC/RagA family outer membrane protein